MNHFGGDWTQQKIDILVEYAVAYLRIMHKQREKYPSWRFAYFDGFAGSGLITKERKDERLEIIGAARRIVEIEAPAPFDHYYFVELSQKNCNLLRKHTQEQFPEKDIRIASNDGNEKLRNLAGYMARKRSLKVLAYIDPCGMQLEWNAISSIASHAIDLWILVPTGIGANRLLTKDGRKLNEKWLDRLELFMGMDRQEIKDYFYRTTVVPTLFGNMEQIDKEEQGIQRIADLYSERLGKLFKHVSKTFALKNSQGSTMFHYLMVSNKPVAVRIANDIIDKYNALK